MRADSISKRYGEREALRAGLVRRRRRRAGRGDRPQRRRQDDAAADPRGRAAADGGHVSRRRPESAGSRSSPALYSKLSVAENLRLFARLEKVPDVERTVGRMLEQTALAERAGDEVGLLSGGNRQRVNIAIGLLGEPRGAAARRAVRVAGSAPARAAVGVPAPSSARPSCSRRTTSARPSATPTACSCSPTASCCSPARPPSWRPRPAAAPPRRTSRPRSSASSTTGATGMRWLLLKDLQILRRSPLLVALLVIYPIVIAVLFGLALSGGPDKPRVAFANLVPEGDDARSTSAAASSTSTSYAGAAVRVDRPDSRRHARGGDREGPRRRGARRDGDPGGRDREAAGDARARRRRGADDRGLLQRRGPGEAPLRRVDDRARLADANKALSDAVLREAAGYIDVIVRGGDVVLPLVGDDRHPRAAARAGDHRQRRRRRCRRTRPQREELEQVSRFAQLAADNLDVSTADPRRRSARRCRSSARSSTAARRRSTRSRSPSRWPSR